MSDAKPLSDEELAAMRVVVATAPTTYGPAAERLLATLDQVLNLGKLALNDRDKAIHEANELVDQVNARHEELDDIQNFLCGMAWDFGAADEHNRTHSQCAFCGHDGLRKGDVMLQHILSCEKHPFAAERAAREKAERQAAAMRLELERLLDKRSQLSCLVKDERCYDAACCAEGRVRSLVRDADAGADLFTREQVREALEWARDVVADHERLDIDLIIDRVNGGE